MDRQVWTRLLILASILGMVILAAASDVSRVLVLAVAVPLGFVAAAFVLLAAPYAAVRKAEEQRLGLRRFLDFLEHGTVLAWVELGVLWCTTGVAFMGTFNAGPGYLAAFLLLLVLGLSAAMMNLYYSEEPDSMQAPWQQHPL